VSYNYRCAQFYSIKLDNRRVLLRCPRDGSLFLTISRSLNVTVRHLVVVTFTGFPMVHRNMNVSFSGCGFLGIYHIGVASCLKTYAPYLLENKLCGSSAGAISACCLLCDIPLGEYQPFIVLTVVFFLFNHVHRVNDRFRYCLFLIK